MTRNQFDRWVNTQLRECKRVTGISKEDVEYAAFVHFPEIKTKRNIEHGVFGSDNNDTFCIVIFDNNRLRLINVETGKSGLGNDHDGNSIYDKFDPVAVDNIIKYSNAYMKAYEKKISEIEQKIEKIKDKMENNSSTTEMIDALFAPMMEEYEQAEGKDIFDLLDELED